MYPASLKEIANNVILKLLQMKKIRCKLYNTFNLMNFVNEMNYAIL